MEQMSAVGAVLAPRPASVERIRVLVFTNTFRVGGSERQAVELIRSLDRDRFEPIVACFRHDGPLLRDLPADLPPPEAFPLTAFWHAGAAYQAWRFLRLLRRRRVAVVQCFDFYANVFAIPLARLAGVPVVLGSRRDEGTVRTTAQRRVERWCYRHADAVVANGAAIGRQLVERDGLPKNRVVVVHNGIDLGRFDRLAERAPGQPTGAVRGPTVAVVANLRPEKGHLVFLEAAARLAQRCPDAEFVIAGDGPERDRIAARIATSAAAPHVRMAGAVANVAAFLRDVDIVALPSLTNEGFPNAAMEAMAAARPLVATDSGATRELVVDGVTGYLVPPGDAAQLADRLAELCADPLARRRMGARGRERVASLFTADRMGHRFGTLFETLLARAARAGGGRR
jgi:glycosyltransferase involved in cell wall biosynthesis